MVVAVVVADASVAIVEVGSIKWKKNRFNLPNPYSIFLVSSLFELQQLSKNQNKSTTRPGDTGPLVVPTLKRVQNHLRCADQKPCRKRILRKFVPLLAKFAQIFWILTNFMLRSFLDTQFSQELTVQKKFEVKFENWNESHY